MGWDGREIDNNNDTKPPPHFPLRSPNPPRHRHRVKQERDRGGPPHPPRSPHPPSIPRSGPRRPGYTRGQTQIEIACPPPSPSASKGETPEKRISGGKWNNKRNPRDVLELNIYRTEERGVGRWTPSRGRNTGAGKGGGKRGTLVACVPACLSKSRTTTAFRRTPPPTIGKEKKQDDSVRASARGSRVGESCPQSSSIPASRSRRKPSEESGIQHQASRIHPPPSGHAHLQSHHPTPRLSSYITHPYMYRQ